MAVVRIDDELLKRIRRFLDTNSNQYQYPTVSCFINNIIYEKLNKMSRRKK